MGYMGFGMRKEVYRRKPKKAFKTLRDRYDQGLASSTSKKAAKKSKSASDKKHSYKPFDQTRIYRNLKLVIFLLIGCALTWALFIKEHYDRYAKKQFEKEGFKELYQSDLMYLGQIFNIIDKRRHKFMDINYYERLGDYDLKIKHPHVHEAMSNGQTHYVYFDGGWRSNRMENPDYIKDEVLVCDREGVIILEMNWKYQMKNVVASQIPSSVVKYLEFEESEFAEFMALVAKYKNPIEIENGMIKADFYHKDFGSYKIIYSEYELRQHQEDRYGVTYNHLYGTLSDNIYWYRSEHIRNQ